MNISCAQRLFAILMVGLTAFISLSLSGPSIVVAQSPKSATATPIVITTPAPSSKKSTATKLPKELFGIVWERMDSERGQLWLRFFESGKYVAGHGPLDTLDGVVHSGNFLYKDGMLTFKNGWSDCNGMSFGLRLLSNNRWLFLDPVSVQCDDRSAFANKRWNRYVIKSAT